MSKRIFKGVYGENGGIFHDGSMSGTESGEFCAIQIIKATKFHTLTWPELSGDNIANTTSGSAVTVPAGVTIYGQITTFRIHSGTVMAYKSGK